MQETSYEPFYATLNGPFFSLYICQDILRRWGWIHWRITQRVCDLQQVLEQSIIYWVYDLQLLGIWQESDV